MMKIAFCLLTASGVLGAEVIKQVQVISRHGASAEVVVSSLDLSNDPPLTRIGEKEMYDLGVWLRTRYNGMGLIDVYNTTSSHFETSEYEQTIVSANSLAIGLFPADKRSEGSLLNVPPSNIPVYMTERENDIVIRSYDKCPEFLSRLADLYTDTEWKATEADHLPLLGQLGANPLFQQYANNERVIPLQEVYNVYDAIRVARTVCVDIASSACINHINPALLNSVTDDQWNELQSLTHYAELRKYGQATAGTILGGNLLLRIQQRMIGDATSVSNRRLQGQNIKTFYHYSAHYPTILALLSALSLRPVDSKVIPSFGSALIFELVEETETGEQFVRLFYREGGNGSGFSGLFNMVLVGACNEKQLCPLDAFYNVVGSIGYSTSKEWCDLCENDATQVCVNARVHDLEEALEGCEAHRTSFSAIVAIFMFGGGFGMCLLVGIHHLARKQDQKELSDPDNIIDLDMDNRII